METNDAFGQVIGPDPEHPDNRGLSLWLMGLAPLDGGSILPDITGGAGATLAGGAAWANTPYSQSAYLGNGSTSRAALPAAAVLPGTTYSVAAWARLVSGFGLVILSCRSQTNATPVRYLLDYNGGGIRFLFRGDTSNAGNANGALSTPALWHRFVGTRSGDTATLYVDGSLISFASPGSSVGTITSSDALIGASYAGSATPSNVLAGAVASVRMLTRVLSADEVARDYELSRDPDTDPRLLRLSLTSYFIGGL